MAGKRAVNLLRALLAAEGLPQTRPVVQVVRDDRAVPFSRDQRLLYNGRGRLRERRIDAASVKPPDAERPEDVVPIDLPCDKLTRGGMPPVRHPNRASDSESALGEVEAIARLAPNAVEGCPSNEGSVHAPLQNKVFDEPPDLVIGKASNNGRPLVETPAQPADDVVLAAPFPNPKGTSRSDPSLAGIETQHHLTECHRVVAAVVRAARRKANHERRGSESKHLLLLRPL